MSSGTLQRLQLEAALQALECARSNLMQAGPDSLKSGADLTDDIVIAIREARISAEDASRYTREALQRLREGKAKEEG